MATTDPPRAAPTMRAVVANLAAGLLLVGVLAGGGYLGYTRLAGAGSGAAAANTLQLVVGGVPTALPAAVPIRGKLAARVALEPAGARYHHTLALAFVDGATGAPLAAPVAVHALATMRFMDHDAFTAEATADAGGAARLPLAFPMPGEWRLDLTLQTPDGPASLAFFATILV